MDVGLPYPQTETQLKPNQTKPNKQTDKKTKTNESSEMQDFTKVFSKV